MRLWKWVVPCSDRVRLRQYDIIQQFSASPPASFVRVKIARTDNPFLVQVTIKNVILNIAYMQINYGTNCVPRSSNFISFFFFFPISLNWKNTRKFVFVIRDSIFLFNRSKETKRYNDYFPFLVKFYVNSNYEFGNNLVVYVTSVNIRIM